MKYRLSFGRLLTELLYSRHTSITRANGKFALNISLLARRIRIRPIRLRELLDWAASHDLISIVGQSSKIYVIKLTPIETEAECEENDYSYQSISKDQPISSKISKWRDPR